MFRVVVRELEEEWSRLKDFILAFISHDRTWKYAMYHWGFCVHDLWKRFGVFTNSNVVTCELLCGETVSRPSSQCLSGQLDIQDSKLLVWWDAVRSCGLRRLGQMTNKKRVKVGVYSIILVHVQVLCLSTSTAILSPKSASETSRPKSAASWSSCARPCGASTAATPVWPSRQVWHCFGPPLCAQGHLE